MWVHWYPKRGHHPTRHAYGISRGAAPVQSHTRSDPAKNGHMCMYNPCMNSPFTKHAHLQRAHRTWWRRCQLRWRDLIRSGILLSLLLPPQPRCVLLATTAAAAPPWAAAARAIPCTRTRSSTRSRTRPCSMALICATAALATAKSQKWSCRGVVRGGGWPPTQTYLIRMTMTTPVTA